MNAEYPVRLLRFWQAVFSIFFAVLVCRAASATVTWTGTGGTSWATTTNWSNSAGPGTTDTTAFTNAGDTNSPGNVTSVLNVSRTIGALTFSETSGNYQTLDLNKDTLTIAGNLNFNQDQNSSTTTTIRDGTLIVSGPYANVNVDCGVSGSSIGLVDLSGLSSFQTAVGNFLVGSSTSGTANGTLTLCPSNNITAQLVQIGAGNNSSDSAGTLHLGLSNTISTAEFDVGANNSAGTVSIVNGGTLTLGTTAQPTDLTIGNYAFNEGTTFATNMNLTGAVFNATLSQLIVGLKDDGGGYGNPTATLTGGTGGSVTVGTAAVPGNIYVGRMLTAAGNETVTGDLNFSGLASLTANVTNFTVGTEQANSGSAQGTALLAVTNNITAGTIDIGDGTASTSTLTLGLHNTILASSFYIGQNGGNANVNMPTGGSLTLGSTASPTGLFVSFYDVNSGLSDSGELNLSGDTFNATLSQLVVGYKDDGGGYGNQIGTLIGGAGGSVTVGSSGSPGNIYVGRMLTAAGNETVAGNVDFSALTSFTATVSNFTVGTELPNSGTAQGTMLLPATNTITATLIDIGDGTSSTSTLALGKTNTILATSFYIGQNGGNASVTIPAGGSLKLGSTTSPSGLFISYYNLNSGQNDSSKLDLTGALFTANLSQLIVGYKDDGGGYGTQIGTLIGGTGGAVTVGSATSPGNIYVGKMLTAAGNESVTGDIDFSGLASFTANVTAFTIGTALPNSGTSQGSVQLAATNTITATALTVGDYGSGLNTLTLGATNTILANQLTIAGDVSNGSVTLPAGGSLTLGSASARTTLAIATGSGNNSYATYTGTFDMTGGTLVAYLAGVTIGDKASQSGNGAGTMTIGNSAANYINATSVLIGGNQSTGVLNYGGGQFYAGSITSAGGTATFNWTGGTLSVGTFGTAAIPLNLNNTGSGTLAPGTSASIVATTSIFGNYTQGAAATTAFDITGTSPGSGYDQVNISGTAKLAGTISLNMTNAFTPAIGDVFELETYASETGTFTNIIPPTLPSGVAFQLDYSNPGQLLLELVAPITQNFTPSSPFSTFGVAGNWNPQGVPGTSSSAYIINSSNTSKTVTVSASDTLYRLDLQGTVGKVDLEVTNGVTLATANEVIVDTGATMNIQSGGVVIANAGLAGAGATTVNPGGGLTAMLLRQSSLSIGGTVKVPVVLPHNPSSTLSILGTLAIAGSSDNWTGSLDLGNNDLDLQTASLATITDQIKQGFNSGNWTGLGITSSAAANDPLHLTALGVIQNNQGGSALYTATNLFDATTPGVTDILLKYTYYGDTNLDGKVDGTDYSRIDAAFLADQSRPGSVTGWFNGDFNYDGVIDGSDYTLIDNAFNSQGAALSAQIAGATAQIASSSATAVPDPSGWPLLLPSSLAMLCRRRKRL